MVCGSVKLEELSNNGAPGKTDTQQHASSTANMQTPEEREEKIITSIMNHFDHVR